MGKAIMQQVEIKYDLGQWREGLGLSVPQASEALGISTGRFYRSSRAGVVPRVVFLACAMIAKAKGSQQAVGS